MLSAGLGAGKGWLNSYFFITPNQLEKIIDILKLHFTFIGNVEREYEFTTKEEILSSYSMYYKSILSGKKINWKLKSDLRVSVTKSLDIVYKEKEFIHNGIEYKTLSLVEPIINFWPTQLYYKDSSFSYKTMVVGDSFCLGIEMNFPKYIAFLDQGDSEYIQTDNYMNYVLFRQLKEEIRKFTVGCRLASEERVIKTDIRISEEVREKLKFYNSFGGIGLRIL